MDARSWWSIMALQLAQDWLFRPALAWFPSLSARRFLLRYYRALLWEFDELDRGQRAQLQRAASRQALYYGGWKAWAVAAGMFWVVRYTGTAFLLAATVLLGPMLGLAYGLAKIILALWR
ncbi:MAG: hypothetical protein N2690_04860 [Rhodocyclaceae bacterium]|nr:hypothetical protein [Rhodocyclaceae bacterium]